MAEEEEKRLAQLRPADTLGAETEGEDWAGSGAGLEGEEADEEELDEGAEDGVGDSLPVTGGA